MHPLKTYQLLGITSSVPFIALGLAALSPLSFGNLQAAQLLCGYAVVVASFMGGTLWGGTFSGTRASHSDAVVSVTAALSLWPALWMPQQSLLLFLALLFALLLAYDLIRFKQRRIPSWYCRLRIVLSTVAIASIAITTLGH